MLIITRPALTTDIDFARHVHHQAYKDVVTRQFGTWDEQAQDGFFNGDWIASAYEIVVCDGVPCGYLCVLDHEKHIHIIDIVLLSAFQGRGIGTHILRQIIERAKARQVPIKLGALKENRAIALYQRLGFKEFKRTETQILMEWRYD